MSPSARFVGLPEPRDTKQFDSLERLISGEESASEQNYRRLREARNGVSELVELTAICANLGRFIVFLVTQNDLGRGIFLEVNGHRSILGQTEGRLELLSGENVRFELAGESFQRSSPLLARLVPVLIEAYQKLAERYRTKSSSNSVGLSA